MTLTEFLLARLAENKAIAQSAIYERDRVFAGGPRGPDWSLTAWPDAPVPSVLIGPERLLAECEAKRRIVNRYQAQLDRQGDPEESQLAANICVTEYAEWILPALALPTADHPDYDEKWRP